MMYENFALMYDELMYDQPYDQWLKITEHYLDGSSLLDLGCGTGNFTALLDKEIDVAAIDISPEMLSVAQQKADWIQWMEADMMAFDLDRTFDMITCYCDSMNYITEEHDLDAVFKNVKSHLSADGTFIFDVHSQWKMEHLFNDMTYTDDTEHVTYIWNALKGELPDSVDHEMTFFVQDNDVYHRYDETHFQRTFPIETYKELLEANGLEVVHLFADFEIDAPICDTAERIFIVVKHKR